MFSLYSAFRKIGVVGGGKTRFYLLLVFVTNPSCLEKEYPSLPDSDINKNICLDYSVSKSLA